MIAVCTSPEIEGRYNLQHAKKCSQSKLCEGDESSLPQAQKCSLRKLCKGDKSSLLQAQKCGLSKLCKGDQRSSFKPRSSTLKFQAQSSKLQASRSKLQAKINDIKAPSSNIVSQSFERKITKRPALCIRRDIKDADIASSAARANTNNISQKLPLVG